MTKKLTVGGVAVGGGAPVTIQSMCNTKTHDVDATVAQIHALEDVVVHRFRHRLLIISIFHCV